MGKREIWARNIRKKPLPCLRGPNFVSPDFPSLQIYGEDAVGARRGLIHRCLAHHTVRVADEEEVESIIFDGARDHGHIRGLHIPLSVLAEHDLKKTKGTKHSMNISNGVGSPSSFHTQRRHILSEGL